MSNLDYQIEPSYYQEIYQIITDKKAFTVEAEGFRKVLPRYWVLISKVADPNVKKNLEEIYSSIVKKIDTYDEIVLNYFWCREMANYLLIKMPNSEAEHLSDKHWMEQYKIAATYFGEEIIRKREDISYNFRVIRFALKNNLPRKTDEPVNF